MRRFLPFLLAFFASPPLEAAHYRAHNQTFTATGTNTTITFTDNGSGGDGAPLSAKSVVVYNAGPGTVYVDCKDETASAADTAVLAGATIEILYMEGYLGYSSCGFIANVASVVTVVASHPRAITAESRDSDDRSYWSCSLDGIGTTLTECRAAPAASLKLYLTDIVAQSTTATAGLFLLRYGTGVNCATGTTSLFPAAATVVRVAYPGNASAPTVIRLTSPLSAAAANAICVIGVVTNTVTIQLSGYTAP